MQWSPELPKLFQEAKDKISELFEWVTSFIKSQVACKLDNTPVNDTEYKLLSFIQEYESISHGGLLNLWVNIRDFKSILPYLINCKIVKVLKGTQEINHNQYLKLKDLDWLIYKKWTKFESYMENFTSPVSDDN